jgi:hypothetical protein
VSHGSLFNFRKASQATNNNFLVVIARAPRRAAPRGAPLKNSVIGKYPKHFFADIFPYRHMFPISIGFVPTNRELDTKASY